MLLAHVVVRWRVLAGPIALVERYRTGQVWDLADGRVGREGERYPTTCGAQNVRFSQHSHWSLLGRFGKFLETPYRLCAMPMA